MKLWSDGHPNEQLWLLTEEEYNELPDGTALLSIMNKVTVKGRDKIGMDTRAGVIAYGLNLRMAESQGLRDKFIVWLLQS